MKTKHLHTVLENPLKLNYVSTNLSISFVDGEIHIIPPVHT